MMMQKNAKLFKIRQGMPVITHLPLAYSAPLPWQPQLYIDITLDFKMGVCIQNLQVEETIYQCFSFLDQNNEMLERSLI